MAEDHDDDENGHDESALTRLVHSGRDAGEQFGFVNPPVVRGSTVLFPDVASLTSGDARYTYGRHGSPTIRLLEEALAELEGGACTRLAPSGLAAISAALLAFVEAGDHVLVTDSVYRPTRRFCDRVLKRLGVETEYYDPVIGKGIEALMRENTRLVFTESPGSQSFEMQDIPAIAAAAHERGAWVLTDNTWATPLYFKPFDHGVDVSIQAATKYIVGHSDAMLGAMTANARAADRVKAIHTDFGLCPGPEDCYLALRGMRTMGVRLERHQQAGLEIARWLSGRPEVSRVLHPGLPEHPGHAIWQRDYTGASGLFSVILHPASREAVAAMLDGLKLFGLGFSWGGFESLVVPFDPSSYRSATTWNPEGPALRFHIGLEDVDDLKKDLAAGFERLNAYRG
ncbi:cystathionine beta-lyase [Dichotomicrobium thermohalophilum]|uniref:Cystathionine beta-lyase n=1 Tax=Dichotomicrobium thermohalophilum TaxID=933063 RepID=A0A397Q8N4_9HYPH|nr:cystathionine beta-lyase [Dichotomicrobium thermohalophilum]RIA55897.1 cystathionine beta-lyase [Dichotomicrobium thermohalophilum]